ncbi:MAG: DoxX family protein [Bradyrhizobiaceae bacterium]|nr:DoxX family protein [Bradyrhizobiaceae bacterium]
MTVEARTGPGVLGGIAAFVRRTVGLMESIPYWLVALFARVPIAGVFWLSGRTKVNGWNIFQVNDSAVLLFENEFQVPLLDPVFAAHITALAEHIFPVLLVLGLATRYAALALLAMTAVIQIFVYPDAWPTHGTWAACLLILIARGAGAVSLDHLIARRFG